MSTFPTKEQFKTLCEKYPGKLIPVARRFLADSLSPVAAYQRLSSGNYGFILESVERGDRIGRYSFVGAVPEAVFSAVVKTPREISPDDKKLVFDCKWDDLRKPERSESSSHTDPLKLLEEKIAGWETITADQMAVVQQTTLTEPTLPPFIGGAVGWMGYDTIRCIEPRLAGGLPQPSSLSETPDLCMPFYRSVLVFDHVKNVLYVISNADPSDGGADVAFDRTCSALDDIVMRLRASASAKVDELHSVTPTAPAGPPQGNFNKPDFLKSVEKTKEYIHAGDVIQTVLSQRFTRTTTVEPFELYRSLRAVNPSPYMFHLRCGNTYLVGSSPEVLVRVEDKTITVRPIAGTRKRGGTPTEDAALAQDLLSDPKEIAEHVMLLDLGRNDVGRASDYGSVSIDEKMIVEYYSHVMHIVSNVTGKMRDDLNAFDVLRACFPAGTLSGAPKIRAMEIIDELEPDARGPYGGAVGAVDFHGNLNTCIAIRTFVIQDQGNGKFAAHVQAGAGIVADSIPENEYQETINKASALLRALDAAEARQNKN